MTLSRGGQKVWMETDLDPLLRGGGNMSGDL